MVLILFINTRIRDDTRYDKFQRKYFSLIFTQLKCKSCLRRVKSWNKGNSSSEYAKFEHRPFKCIFPRSISLNILIKTHFDFKKKSSQPFLTWYSMMKLRKQIRHSWNKFGKKKEVPDEDDWYNLLECDNQRFSERTSRRFQNHRVRWFSRRVAKDHSCNTHMSRRDRHQQSTMSFVYPLYRQWRWQYSVWDRDLFDLSSCILTTCLYVDNPLSVRKGSFIDYRSVMMIIILNDIRNSRRNDALIFVFILSDHVFTCIIIFISEIEFQSWNYDKIRYQSEIFHT